MADEIEPIIDETGKERRCGSLLPPRGFVSSFQTFESEKPVWDDSDILKAIRARQKPRRQTFAPKWVQDQKSHGSCNGYAGAGAYAKARYLRGYTDGELFSGAFLYSLINGGRDQGSALESGMKAIQKTGICKASTVSWDMIYPNKQPANAKTEAAQHKGLQCYAVQTRQGFRTAVAAGFPVIVAVHAGRNFQRLSNGIAGVDNGPGNHAVHVDDISLIGGKECYDMQNSWNLSYGENGRAWLTWDSFEQTFGRHVFFAVASTEEGDG